MTRKHESTGDLHEKKQERNSTLQRIKINMS